MKSARLPRFRRSPSIAAMELTERDREILRCIHRHRFLRSGQVTILVHGSQQQILRRLQRLYHHGFLDRPRCQINYYHRGGSQSIAYGLGRKGVGLLKRESSIRLLKHDWPSKHVIQQIFLEHALLVSDLMVALEVACRKRPGVRLIRSEDALLPQATAMLRDPFRWSVTMERGRQCGVIPDRVFGLEVINENGRKSTSWFCLEADRGTMPVTRLNLDKSSFFRKLLAYQATWGQKLHRSRFGWQRFRVITVTTSIERMKHLVETCRRLNTAHGLFLFAVADASLASDLLAFEWTTGRGEATTLLS